MSDRHIAYSTLKITDITKSADGERRIKGIASTATPDRDQDILDPLGASFTLPFPLLAGHDSQRPIGEVVMAKVSDKGIEIEAVIPKDTGLGYVEMAWNQIASGLIKGLSVGFRATKVKPIKDGGLHFQQWAIHELSAVAIPANPDAMITAKSIRAVAQQGSRPSKPLPSVKKAKPMKLSERITAAQTQMATDKDHLVSLAKSLDDILEDDTDGLESANLAIEAQTDLIETNEKSLAVLLKAETALATKAVAVVETDGTIPAVARQEVKGDADLFVKHAAAVMEAYVRRVPLEQIEEKRYSHDPRVKAVGSVLTKAAQNPAMTNVSGWAEELTRMSYGAFMDMLKSTSVVPLIPMDRHEFGGFASIQIASRTGAQGDLPNLAAAFRAEGDPIRVGAASLGSKKLTPKSMGIIGTFTNELFERSTPNIETMIRQWMQDDTSFALDGVFLGNGAASATTPAGIQNGLAAADTAASTGGTHAEVVADLKARLSRFGAQNMGRRPVWIMNPARKTALDMLLTAVGGAAFPSLAQNMLVGIPVISSTNVPAGVVFLIDAAYVSFAGGAPRFLGTDVATIHETALQADVKPIVGASATAVASPVRSLYQTNSAALRMIIELDWLITRPGAVQTITAVTW